MRLARTSFRSQASARLVLAPLTGMGEFTGKLKNQHSELRGGLWSGRVFGMLPSCSSTLSAGCPVRRTFSA